MPTYDYACTSCGHVIEVIHSIHGKGPDACPLCGSPMKKAIALPTVHFKGSGWARKESSGGRPPKAEPKGSGASGKPDSDSGGSAEQSTGPKAGEPSAATTGEASVASAQKDSD